MRRPLKPLAAITGLALIFPTAGCDRAVKTVAPVELDTMPDVTLVFEISSDTTIQRGKFKIKGTRARTDTEEGLFSTIHDPEAGTTVLDHANKAYQTIQLELADNSQMSPETAAKLARACEMRFTGKKKKIGNWNCEEFVLFDSFDKGFPDELQTRCVGWITNDLKGGAAIQARKNKMAPSQLVKWMAATTSKDIAFPGFAVRTETTQCGQYPVTSTCLEISYDDIDPKDLEIPSDYVDTSSKKSADNARDATGEKPSN